MAATAGSFWVADCSQQFTDRYDNPEYQILETMFIWGNYPLRANSDGFYGHWVVDLMKRGMEVVMIDPKSPGCLPTRGCTFARARPRPPPRPPARAPRATGPAPRATGPQPATVRAPHPAPAPARSP